MSHSQDRCTYGPVQCHVSAMATSGQTISNSTNISTTSSMCRGRKVWKSPTIGRWRRDATSSSMMDTSLIERWKILVSRCHLSTNEDISLRSPVSIEHAIRGLNPVLATISSIAGIGLPNLCTFLPWEDNFNSGRSWIEV